MHALVIAHGEPVSHALLRRLASRASLVIAADGGLLRARAAGVAVGAIVGDLDSLTPPEIEQLPPGSVHRDSDPDSTDLEKAVAFAFRQGATSVDVTCASGGRMDHALANLSVLVSHRGDPPLRIIDDRFEVSLVDGAASIEGEPGTVISLVAIGECTGVTTTGMRWDLDRHTLRFSARGVHNELAGTHASVSVETGDLLLLRGRWVEKHR